MNHEIRNILISWESSLNRFGKLDRWNLSESLSLLSCYLRTHTESTKERSLIKIIRDTVITNDFNTESVLMYIKSVLNLESDNEDLRNSCIKQKMKSGRIMRNGQEVRFKSETEKIFKERLKFKKGMLLRNFDIETESPLESRKVRRIVEKRMCQAYHHMNKREEGYKTTNNDRYWMHRATSFQLHNIGQKESITHKSRGLSTHWKKQYDLLTGELVFKKKMAYKNEDEAKKAIDRYLQNHPRGEKEMVAYKCAKCNKWHIGHKSNLNPHPIIDSLIPQIAV